MCRFFFLATLVNKDVDVSTCSKLVFHRRLYNNSGTTAALGQNQMALCKKRKGCIKVKNTEW